MRLREAGGDDAADGPTLARLRERVIALLRQEHPGLALDQEAATVPLGAGRRYGRRIDRDVALLEASGFRLATQKEVEGVPFAAAWCERQRWRADYWLARSAPGLTAEMRASVLDRVAAEARASLSSMPQQVMTVYVVMEAVPPR